MKRHYIFYLVIMIMVVSAIIFTHTLITATLYDPEEAHAALASVVSSTSNTTATTSNLTISKYPSRLIIPILNINANVQDVGVNKKGNMGTPNNFTDVAWYEYGIIPGDIGSAVIDGHVDNGLALAGIFKHLANLQIGDDIYVLTVGGNQIHFVVTNISSYDYQSLPLQEIFNNSNSGAQLRLITCGGVWVPGDNGYNQRLVVTAALETSFIPQTYLEKI